ncbi:MAG: DUF4296 domain-containing protein [Bacteroidetes bacterium]|nr:MAG: DUF4296 domain-containing protein [Bacteroidota bacterium]
MIKTLKYILLVVLSISCKNNNIEKPKKPDNLISKDKMVEVIYDISLINSAKGVNKKLIENEGISPEDYIYKRHDIDSLQFALSNEYYAYNLKIYEDIYNTVKEKLEKDKKHFQAITEAEQKIKDSINKKTRGEFDSLRKIDKLIPKKNRKRDSIFPSPIKKIDTSLIKIRQ